MMTSREDKLLELVKAAFHDEERVNCESAWKDIAQFVLNNEYKGFEEHYTVGSKNMIEATDSTAIRANEELAAIIHSTLTSSATKWAVFKFSDPKMANNKQYVKLLSEATDKWYSAINDSNFAQEVARAYRHYTSFGNMCLFMEDGDPSKTGISFRFKALHIGQVAWKENGHGIVDTVFYREKKTLEELIRTYGDAVPEELRMAAQEKPGERHVVYMIIRPRAANKLEQNILGLAAPSSRPFEKIVMLPQEKVILEEDGYYEFPFAVPRWSTAPNEIYGRSRAHIGLPTIMSLNKLVEKSLIAADRNVTPPLITTNAALLGNFTAKPNYLNFVQDMDEIREFTTRVDFNAKNYDIERLVNEVLKIFYIDKLLLPPRTETGEMTMFEVRERLEQVQRVLGPVIGRLEAELLSPVAQRTFQMMLRDGQFPELQAVFDQAGGSLEIEFVSPLARAQKISEVSNMQAWIQEAIAIAQAGIPEAADIPDIDAYFRKSAKILGLDPDISRSEEEVRQIREQRAQAQQQQMQAEQANLAADRAAKEAKANPGG